MKSYGKVISYNKVYGTIKCDDGSEYVILYKNVIDKDINESDIVEFEKETVKSGETSMNIARFIRTLKKK